MRFNKYLMLGFALGESVSLFFNKGDHFGPQLATTLFIFFALLNALSEDHFRDRE